MEFEAAIREAFKRSQHRKCIELIESAPADVRNSSKFKILMGSCLNNIGGQSKRALQVLDEVISSDPGNAVAYYGKGLVYINEAKLEEAVQNFDRAIELDPSEKMDKARQMKIRVQNMMSPRRRGPKKITPTKKSAKSSAKTTEGTHVCSECGKSFTQSHNLIRHMVTHNGERTYSCDHCDKKFFHEADRNRHSLVHKKVGTFDCTICGKAFKTEKNLQNHVSRHPSELNHKCEKCGKAFATSRSLNYHVRTHSYKKKEAAQDNNIEAKSLSESGEDSNLLEEVKIKDEFCEFQMGNETEAEDIDNSDDGIHSSQSLTFGELEPMTEDDSDWSFCVSLLNEMSKMNDDQKADFRAKTRQSIKDILN